MKKLKRIAALVLMLTLVLALTVSASAAGTGTITVANPQPGQTYTAYKIFDVSYNADKSAYSYTIDSSNEWFEVVKAYADTAVNGLTLTQVNDSTTYVVTTTDAFSAPSFAAVLRAGVEGKNGTQLTLADGTATAAGLDLGYYFVTSSTGALCNLTTTDPSVTIHDKNDNPFDKVDDKESVDVGEVVNYVVTGKVPDTTGFETYKYEFTDKMSEGLTFNNDVKVYVGGVELTGNYTLKTGIDANGYDFILDIDVKNLQAQVGAKIEVRYSATVNENAVAKVEKNHATLEYSNDPTDLTKTTIRQDEETVYTAKIVIDKYESGNETKKLAGAEFVLYKEVTAADSGAAEKLYYKWNDTDNKVEWVKDKSAATVKTTDSSGAASFDGLADGTYYLEEIKAPAGYNLLNAPVSVTVAGSNTETALLTVTEDVANQKGTELPSTGGIGTTVFYIIGSVLVLGAIVLLVTKKRMGSNG